MQKSDESLADGWQAVLDESSNEYYYWNTVTNETTWDKPVASASPGKQPEKATTTATKKRAHEPATDEKDDLDAEKEATRIATQKYFDAFQASLNLPTAIEETAPPSAAYFQPTTTTSSLQDTTAADTSSQPQQEAEDYKISGFFNSRTGRFESKPELHNAESYSVGGKAKRLMSHYFDYDAWAEERGRKYIDGGSSSGGAAGEVKKKPTKKEMEYFRKKEKEKLKKKRSWLYE